MSDRTAGGSHLPQISINDRGHIREIRSVDIFKTDHVFECFFPYPEVFSHFHGFNKIRESANNAFLLESKL